MFLMLIKNLLQKGKIITTHALKTWKYFLIQKMKVICPGHLELRKNVWFRQGMFWKVTDI